MNHRIVDAFVVNNAPNLEAFFAYSNSISRDLIIGYKFVPKNVDILGKWVRVEVREPNVVCQTVIVIDDLFESRVMGGIPEIRIDAQHDGRFKNEFEMFYHSYFGYISDPRHIITHIDKGASYNIWITRHKELAAHSRWRISLIQDNIAPIRAERTSEPLKLVEGIIHSFTSDGDAYFAWTKSEPWARILVKRTFCPSNMYLLGTWVELSIDSNHHVQRPIVVVRDVFETRVKNGVTEVRVDFRKKYDSDAKFEMFYHQYFGNICDPRNMLGRAENGAWYNGWIVYHQKSEIDARWRLATKQVISGPLNNRNDETRNFEYYADDQYPHIPSQESYRRNYRSSSPDIRNYYGESFQDEFNQRSRSPSPRNYNAYHPADNFSQREKSPYFHRSSSPISSTQLNRSQEKNKRSDSPNSGLSRIAKASTTDSKHVDYSDDEFNEFSSSGNKMRRGQSYSKSQSHQQELCSMYKDRPEKHENIETRKATDRSENSSWNPYGSSTDFAAHDKSVSQKTADRKEIMRIKSQLIRMKRLVLSLATDEKVSKAMKLSNVEEHDELMNLAMQKD